MAIQIIGDPLWWGVVYKVSGDLFGFLKLEQYISKIIIFESKIKLQSRPGQLPARGPHAARQAPLCCPRASFEVFQKAI